MISRSLLGLIDTYRYLLSPLVGQHCRFHPSCSSYARQSILLHGPWRGLLLSASRLLRCHPWHAGGMDPVPSVANPNTPITVDNPDTDI